MAIDFAVYSVDTLAEQYARSRKTRDRPLSMMAAIRAVRTIHSDSRITDQELASIIARKAVEFGHSVEFDQI